MRRIKLLSVLAISGIILIPVAAYPKSLEEIKAEIRAEVQKEFAGQKSGKPVSKPREQKLSVKSFSGNQGSSGQIRPRSSAESGSPVEKFIDWIEKLRALGLNEIDSVTIRMGVVILAVIALIPALIAKRKGRSFIVWWMLGFLFFVFVFPLSLFVGVSGKKKKNKKYGNGTPGQMTGGRTEKGNREMKPAPGKEPRDVNTGEHAELDNEDENGLDETVLSIYDKIERLSKLRDKGIVSEEEFSSKKKELLERI
ncbi:MAG: SHOCT domain-containing protein [Candidatus Omnitrophota bacterium]